MPDAVATLLPRTPAQIAGIVLDQIEAHPGVFDMQNWARLPRMTRLAPDASPSCGTTLCAAGWIAHVTGWTLVDLPGDDQAQVIGRLDSGVEYNTYAQCYAEKDGERRQICDVARDALGLESSETFWYDHADTALARLRQIAGRDQADREPDMDAGTGHGAYEYR